MRPTTPGILLVLLVLAALAAPAAAAGQSRGPAALWDAFAQWFTLNDRRQCGLHFGNGLW